MFYTRITTVSTSQEPTITKKDSRKQEWESKL